MMLEQLEVGDRVTVYNTETGAVVDDIALIETKLDARLIVAVRFENSWAWETDDHPFDLPKGESTWAWSYAIRLQNEAEHFKGRLHNQCAAVGGVVAWAKAYGMEHKTVLAAYEDAAQLTSAIRAVLEAP